MKLKVINCQIFFDGKDNYLNINPIKITDEQKLKMITHHNEIEIIIKLTKKKTHKITIPSLTIK